MLVSLAPAGVAGLFERGRSRSPDSRTRSAFTPHRGATPSPLGEDLIALEIRRGRLAGALGALLAGLIVPSVGASPAFADNLLPVLIDPTIAGGPPSVTCQVYGGTTIVDNSVEGVRTALWTLVRSTNRVDVCFRVEAPGASGGGVISITPVAPSVSVGGVGVPTLGVPSVDSNGSACSTTTPNSVPGTHPVTGGTVAGVPYAFDAYSNATAIWVCLQAGVVNDRVVIPVTPPTIGGIPAVGISTGYDVVFYPDPDTPVVGSLYCCPGI